MPTPFDLLSEQLDDEEDPDDQLRLKLGQDQGANLAGGPEAQPDGQPAVTPPVGAGGMPQPVAPSPNVAGPLSALVKKIKPKIRLLPKKIKPHIKLKSHSASAPPPPKPRIKLKWPTGGQP